MNGDKITLDKFGRNFQLKVLREMIENRDFAISIFDILKTEYFNTFSLQWICKQIIEYVEEYKQSPTKNVLVIKIKEEENDDLKEKFATDLATVFTIERDDFQFVRDKSLDFCRRQNMKEALKQCTDLIREDVKDAIDKIRETIDSAAVAGLTADIGVDYLKDVDYRMSAPSRDCIPTGWQPVDEALEGGLGRGELGIIMAPAGRGKTFLMCNIAAYNILNGKIVIFYTLETTELVIGARIDAYITDILISEVKDNQDKVKQILEEKVTGRLIIKKYPAKSPTITTFLSHLRFLETRNIRPDLIILDYADLIKVHHAKNNEYTTNTYFTAKETYDELKGIAGTFNTPVWSASQVKVDAFEEDIITSDRAAEASSKTHDPDVILTFSRTLKDKDSNTGRLYIAKGRAVADSIVFPVLVNLPKGRLTVLPSDKKSMDLIGNMKDNGMSDNLRAKLRSKLNKFSNG